MSRYRSALLVGMATPIVVAVAGALNPWPGTFWFLIAGAVPMGMLLAIEEVRFRAERKQARSGRLGEFQHAMKLSSRIRR